VALTGFVPKPGEPYYLIPTYLIHFNAFHRVFLLKNIPSRSPCEAHWRLFTFIHLADDAFIQSDLQLLYMSEVVRLWSN